MPAPATNTRRARARRLSSAVPPLNASTSWTSLSPVTRRRVPSKAASAAVIGDGRKASMTWRQRIRTESALARIVLLGRLAEPAQSVSIPHGGRAPLAEIPTKEHGPRRCYTPRWRPHGSHVRRAACRHHRHGPHRVGARARPPADQTTYTRRVVCVSSAHSTVGGCGHQSRSPPCLRGGLGAARRPAVHRLPRSAGDGGAGPGLGLRLRPRAGGDGPGGAPGRGPRLVAGEGGGDVPG